MFCFSRPRFPTSGFRRRLPATGYRLPSSGRGPGEVSARCPAPQRDFGSSELAGLVDNCFQSTRLEGESTWMRLL